MRIPRGPWGEGGIKSRGEKESYTRGRRWIIPGSMSLGAWYGYDSE